jgi:hypothetical protein
MKGSNFMELKNRIKKLILLIFAASLATASLPPLSTAAVGDGTVEIMKCGNHAMKLKISSLQNPEEDLFGVVLIQVKTFFEGFGAPQVRVTMDDKGDVKKVCNGAGRTIVCVTGRLGVPLQFTVDIESPVKEIATPMCVEIYSITGSTADPDTALKPDAQRIDRPSVSAQFFENNMAEAKKETFYVM